MTNTHKSFINSIAAKSRSLCLHCLLQIFVVLLRFTEGIAIADRSAILIGTLSVILSSGEAGGIFLVLKRLLIRFRGVYLIKGAFKAADRVIDDQANNSKSQERVK